MVTIVALVTIVTIVAQVTIVAIIIYNIYINYDYSNALVNTGNGLQLFIFTNFYHHFWEWNMPTLVKK